MEKEKKFYVVIKIGCLECGLDSSLIGIWENKEQAEIVKNKHIDFINEVGYQGQFKIIIEEISKFNEEIYQIEE